ncbi:MAG: ferrous iron transport protein A [Clostridia bacterium]|jgi:ferrous iron transport protein A|nr:ferrous iron transport protein A [Clostridia bacterium]MBR5009727.1 ferrous iron transport protein A [Clostridia bacterium]MBR5985614.1 ferrous iron transport protein A [Clostridia bacterium]MBR6499561.1 ferrous iron transport protein A [Clostridia bacterium]
MMPLTLAETGEEQIIRKVGGSQELKQHLGDMGVVPGGSITVVSTIGGNVIVRIKESRIAISKEMAQKIMI